MFIVTTLFWYAVGFGLMQLIWKWGRKVETTSQRYRQWFSYLPLSVVVPVINIYAISKAGRVDEALFQTALVTFSVLVITCVGAAIHNFVRPVNKTVKKEK